MARVHALDRQIADVREDDALEHVEPFGLGYVFPKPGCDPFTCYALNRTSGLLCCFHALLLATLRRADAALDEAACDVALLARFHEGECTAQAALLSLEIRFD